MCLPRLPDIGPVLTATLLAALEASKAREGYVRISTSHSIETEFDQLIQQPEEGLCNLLGLRYVWLLGRRQGGGVSALAISLVSFKYILFAITKNLLA